MLLSIISFCNCEESEVKFDFDEDSFPSSDQIWGMLGVITAIVACWIYYTKVKICKPKSEERRHHSRTRYTSATRRGVPHMFDK